MTHGHLHKSSSEAGVDVLLEVWVFGGQVPEVWGFVFVSIPRMHRSIQSHRGPLLVRGPERSTVNCEQQVGQRGENE